jgi:hypothetical protein
MYSLDLDGVLDRLVIGDVLDFGTNDFVISLWHKVADYSAETAFLINKHEDNNNKWYIGQVDDGTFGVLVINGGNTTLNDVTADASALEGSWVNIIVVCDRSSATGGVIYVNGATTLGKSAFAPDDDDSPENISISADLTIGSQTGGASAILGNIDEVAIWTHADLSDFDSNAAAAVYNSGKPFDLNYNRGDYDAFTGKLVGYWRMGNGPFDDKANGIVHDAHNPGFGVDLVTNGTFAADSGWTKGSGWTISGGKAIASGNSGDLYQAETGFVNGGVYRVEYTISDYTKGNFRVILYDGSSNHAIGLTRTANGEYLEYVTINQTSGSSTNLIYLQTTASTDEDFKIDNVTVKKLNGFPALAAADATFSADTPGD